MSDAVQWFSSRVVVARATDRLADIAGEVAAHDAQYCAVVDDEHRLQGVLRLTSVATNPAGQTRLLADLLPESGTIPSGLVEGIGQAFRNPARAGAEYAVVDPDGHFLGLVTTESLFAAVLFQQDDFRRAAERLARDQARFEAAVQEKIDRLGADRPATPAVDLSAATFSHDVRSPLRSIQLFAIELLHSGDSTLGPEGRYFAEAIGRAASRLDALAAETLTKGRAAHAGAAVAVNLRELVDDVLMLHGALLREKAAAVEVRGELPRVKGAYVPILQLVANLVSNAVTHVSAGRSPRVQLWAETRGRAAIIYVRDNGPGMPCELPAKFEPFRPGAASAGAGLGLAIAQSAAERLGTRLQFRALDEGGCEVSFELPLAD